ncbi:hypothetical protein ACHQM5_011768 [Ranunculus cassubicifolius]
MGPQRAFVVLHLMVLVLCLVSQTCIGYKLIRNEAIDGVARLNQVVSKISRPSNVFSVEQFGAKGDGRDDTQAFLKAWKKACSIAGATLLVPKNKNYLLKPVKFSGPCKSSTILKLYGTIKASGNRGDYKNSPRNWIVFQNVQNFKVEGGGIINGNGNIWWKNSCKINKSLPCKEAPTAVTFYGCNNLVVRSIKIQNAQQMHLTFQKCVNVQASNLMVTAPESSPNTDGIHITDTKNIQITSTVIGTGDDCFSIENGSQKVRAMDIKCGPGHGISIGSLGDGNSEAHVSDVIVDSATFTKTTNGVRIKTWQGGSGSASNIIFRNIVMKDVKNPIIIDQNYCDRPGPCKEQRSAVQISNVLFQNIKGTSDTDVAVTLNCSKTHPCQGIKMQNVNLVRSNGGAAQGLCNNVKMSEVGKISPVCS